MKIIDVNKGLRLLQDGYVLEAFDKNNHFIFTLSDNNKILVTSTTYNLSLERNDFLNLYKDFSFSLIIDKNYDNTIDLEKDKEYYKTISKKQ